MPPIGGYGKSKTSISPQELISLTKENFWNQIQESHPSAMKVFCDWIDEYKKKVAWRELFGADLMVNHNSGELIPKYHDLPIAMQVGIFLQFASERSIPSFYMPSLWINVPHSIREYFIILDRIVQAHRK